MLKYTIKPQYHNDWLLFKQVYKHYYNNIIIILDSKIP